MAFVIYHMGYSYDENEDFEITQHIYAKSREDVLQYIEIAQEIELKRKNADRTSIHFKRFYRNIHWCSTKREWEELKNQNYFGFIIQEIEFWNPPIYYVIK